MRRTAVTVFCASLLLSTSAFASGFGLREASASAMAFSYAGAAADGTRASNLNFNPGLLGDVDEFDMSSSAIGLLPTTEGTFSATTSAGNAVNGNTTPKDIVNTALIPATGLRYRLTDQIIVGLTISAPWGMVTDYGPDSVTRYYNIASDVKTYNFTPMVGWQPIPQLTIGVGMQIEYIKGRLTKAIDFGTLAAGYHIPGSIPGGQDGFVALKAQDWGYGFVAGAVWKPNANLTLGLAYRSKLDNTLKGTENFTLDSAGKGAILSAATGAFVNGPATAKFTTPSIITFSAKWQATDKLAILFGGDWTGWDVVQNLVAHSSNAHQPDDVTVFNWENSWSGSLGAEYKLSQDWLLRLGVAMDGTPTTDGLRTPGIPDGSRFWISGGVGYRVTDNMDVDFTVARLTANDGLIALNKADTGNTYRGNLNGTVNMAVTLVGFEVSYHL
jgi:long-chain fatty acid transport protein